MEFEWDPKKSEGNRKKHGVSFHDAATVFADRLQLRFLIRTIPRESIDF
jgi:uncharacterized DUF497 family protein